MSIAHFTVYGTPQPQGSIRAFTPEGAKHPVLTSTNKKLKPWRQDLAQIAKNVLDRKQFPVRKPHGVHLELIFFFQRPSSLRKSVERKTTKPDLDKLLRAVCDALTGFAYEDDSQVVCAVISKDFGSPERVEINIGAL